MTLRRRAVLSGMAAASVCAVGKSRALTAAESVQGVEALGRRFAAVLRHSDSFAALGSNLAAQIHEPSVWSERTTPLGPGLAALEKLDDRALLALLHRRIADDLRLGRMVEIDGWVLARTETAIAGLLSGTISRRRA